VIARRPLLANPWIWALLVWLVGGFFVQIAIGRVFGLGWEWGFDAILWPVSWLAAWRMARWWWPR
jgi:hypothetical protein